MENKAILKLVPSLGRKSNAQMWFSIIMIIITLFGALGAGIYADGYGIHPPAQYTGVCPPPAFVQGGNCLTKITVQVVVNGQTTTTTQNVPAGHIILPNGTGR